MTGIYWSEGGARLRDYSATTKAGKTIVTVKIEVTDHFELGHMLRELDAGMKGQRSARRSRVPRQLLLTDQRGRSE